MKKLIYVCDRCGKEITGDIFKIIPEAIDRKTEDYTAIPIYPEQLEKTLLRSLYISVYQCSQYADGSGVA